MNMLLLMLLQAVITSIVLLALSHVLKVIKLKLAAKAWDAYLTERLEAHKAHEETASKSKVH